MERRTRRLSSATAKSRSAKIKSLDSLIGSVLKHYKLDARLKQVAALDIWNEVVGQQIASIAKAQRIEHGNLIVSVEKSVWRNELQFLKKEIIKKLNDKLKEEIVKDIVFR